ncbi:MAG: dehydrogenase [Planctomycetota bacterium]|nr:MAG: dehydrogenase [Planctomycetota bacterium]
MDPGGTRIPPNALLRGGLKPAELLCNRRAAGRLSVFGLLSIAQFVAPETVRGAQAQSDLSAFPKIVPERDWPWWRGPFRNGHAAAKCRPPIRFGERENVLWRSTVPGRGHSSPIVFDQRIFLATADEANPSQSVLAFSINDGHLLWTAPISRGGFPENNHPKNTEASPTLASDGDHLFAVFFHHRAIHLTALDFDGRAVWERTLGAFHPQKYEYGYAPSPVLYRNLVIVAAEHDGPSWIVALDRRTGREVWRTERPPNITFSTPVVAHVAGRDQLLISGSNHVASYHPANGRLLWQVTGTTAATCGTMVWEGDVVFASGGYPKAETIAVRADGSGQVVWKNNQKCYEQSMIVVGGYLYALTDKGVMYCWRTADGAEMWRQRLAGPVSSSPVYASGHIYWGNEAGTVFVIRPSAERCELVAENRLGTELFASPAVSGDRLIYRFATGHGSQRIETLICISQLAQR